MAQELTTSDVARFKQHLHERFGLTLEQDRDDQIAGVLRVRLAASGCRSFAAYQALLGASAASLA